MSVKTLSIIIPAYNEAHTIEKVLDALHVQELAGWGKEIIVVDDGSCDGTATVVRDVTIRQKGCIRLISHERNRGKGAALRTGFSGATGEALVVQDADLEYDPRDIPLLLQALEDDSRISAVYGSRNINPERQGYAPYVWGVWLLTALTNFLYGAKLTDVYTGYKLFRTEALKRLNLCSDGFEFEAEVTVKLLKSGARIKEVPIRYNPRTFREGKKIRFRDGLVGLWTVLKNCF
ncbi:MAG: glycosyltransferase family 2 protein [bacterium]|nr:glycosyltransferase family 2 protein [bacterium]